jgi:hypothetical protein
VRQLARNCCIRCNIRRVPGDDLVAQAGLRVVRAEPDRTPAAAAQDRIELGHATEQ